MISSSPKNQSRETIVKTQHHVTLKVILVVVVLGVIATLLGILMKGNKITEQNTVLSAEDQASVVEAVEKYKDEIGRPSTEERRASSTEFLLLSQ